MVRTEEEVCEWCRAVASYAIEGTAVCFSFVITMVLGLHVVPILLGIGILACYLMASEVRSLVIV